MENFLFEWDRKHHSVLFYFLSSSFALSLLSTEMENTVFKDFTGGN